MAIVVLMDSQSAYAQETPAQAYTPNEAVSLTRSAIKQFGSKLGKIEIRTPTDPGRDPADVTDGSPIIILVGDTRADALPGVYSNCTGDSALRLVTCDLRVLDDLIDGLSLSPNPAYRDQTRVQLFRLILAHELGHVALKHPSAHYHGSPDGFSVFSYASHRIELEADSYAVDLIEGAKDDAVPYQSLVLDLAIAAVRRSRCPETFPEPCPCPAGKHPLDCIQHPYGPGIVLMPDEEFAVTLSGTHPQFIVRFVRMMLLSHDAQMREIFAPQAERVLQHVLVRNEAGTAEPVSNLFTPADRGSAPTPADLSPKPASTKRW